VLNLQSFLVNLYAIVSSQLFNWAVGERLDRFFLPRRRRDAEVYSVKCCRPSSSFFVLPAGRLLAIHQGSGRTLGPVFLPRGRRDAEVEELDNLVFLRVLLFCQPVVLWLFTRAVGECLASITCSILSDTGIHSKSNSFFNIQQVY